MKVTYPAIFTPEENGMFSVRFPDIHNAVTCGEGLTEAIEMAADVLGGLLAADFIEEKRQMPTPPKELMCSLKKMNLFLMSVWIPINLSSVKKPSGRTLQFPNGWQNVLIKRTLIFQKS